MKLLYNWRDVLRHAWSIRLMLLAGFLTGLEAILPFIGLSVPDGAFAILTLVIICAAFVTRLLAQKGLSE